MAAQPENVVRAEAAVEAVSGRRETAPGRVITAIPSSTTAVSSTNTASGRSGSSGRRRTVAPSLVSSDS
jgi:hypothetical protein